MAPVIDFEHDVFIMKKALYKSNHRSKTASKYKNWIGNRYMFYALNIGQSVLLLGCEFMNGNVVTSPLVDYSFDDSGLLHLVTANTEYIFEKETP